MKIFNYCLWHNWEFKTVYYDCADICFWSSGFLKNTEDTKIAVYKLLLKVVIILELILKDGYNEKRRIFKL